MAQKKDRKSLSPYEHHGDPKAALNLLTLGAAYFTPDFLFHKKQNPFGETVISWVLHDTKLNIFPTNTSKNNCY